jgi:hypothetical protein
MGRDGLEGIDEFFHEGLVCDAVFAGHEGDLGGEGVTFGVEG